MSAMRATGMKSATPLRPCGRVAIGTAFVAPAVIRDRAERIAVAAARQADLPERGGEHGAHPDGLLAMLGALERVRHHDERAAAVEPARQRS